MNDSNFEIDSNFYGDWLLPPYSAFVFTSSLPDDVILGDVNLDGFINVLDVVLVVGCIVGSCNVDDASSGDYNQDGLINVLDVVMIVNFIVNQ